MDWWVWVLLIALLGGVSVLWWWSSGRAPGAYDHPRARQPGQEEFRSW